MKVRIYKRNGLWYARDGAGHGNGFVTWDAALLRALLWTER